MSMKKQRMIKLQFSGRNLKNLDVFSKSDPFLIISRRNASQVLTQVRRTETKNNNLNPDWSVLYMSLNELCESDFNTRLQIDVKDDDGATSELIGSVEVTLAELEAAYCNHTSVQLLKKNKPRGEILVRNCTIDPQSFQEMVSLDSPGKDTADFKSSNYGYLPPTQAQGPGYPPAQTPGYPPAQTPGYPPAQGPGYPPAQGPGYPPAQTPGYPLAQGPGYPPANGPENSLYPSLGPDIYPQTTPGYPPSTGVYPSAPVSGYKEPLVHPGYPAAPAGLPYPPSPFQGVQNQPGAPLSPWNPSN